MSSQNNYLESELTQLCESIITFPHNDYKQKIKQYTNFIKKRKTKTVLYGHIHHIIPKCLGGSNQKSNLIELTEKDHIKAHILLSYIFNGHHGLNSAVKILTQEFQIELPDNDDEPVIRIELFDINEHIQSIRNLLHREGYIYDKLNKILIDPT